MNPHPSRCHRDAQPVELQPHIFMLTKFYNIYFKQTTNTMAAKDTSKRQNTSTFKSSSNIKRPGVHSKKKTSKLKSSKNYKKSYKGQG